MKINITSRFGDISPIRNWQPHNGLDIALPEGTPLKALQDGTVTQIFNGNGLIGKGFKMRFKDGTEGIYGHMDKVKVKVGEHIDKGEIVGLSGNTGNSTGPHLHFGLKDAQGNFIDPEPLISNAAVVGKQVHYGIFDGLVNSAKDTIREQTQEVATEILFGVLDVLKDLLLSVTLVGAGVLILLKVAGYRDGGRWASVLIVVNILIKFLFGVF